MSFSLNVGFETNRRAVVELSVQAFYAAHGIVLCDEMSQDGGMYLLSNLSGEEAYEFRVSLEKELGIVSHEQKSEFYKKLDSARAAYVSEIAKLSRYTEVRVVSADYTHVFTHS